MVLARISHDELRSLFANFWVFGPDENTSNKLNAIYEASKKFWMPDYLPEDAE